MTAWPGQMVGAGLSIGTGCQTWSPRGVRQCGGDRQDPAVSRGAAAKACSLSGGSSQDWHLNKNVNLDRLHSFTGLKLQRGVDSGCSYIFAHICCSDEDVWNFSGALVLWLIASALFVHISTVCWCRTRFSCCPTFPDSLSFPFTYFSLSYLCNLIFHSHFSTPSSINLQSFLPSQLFFASIPLFWLHPPNYSSSPLYPWKSNTLSFFPPSHSYLFSLFFRSWKDLHKLSVFAVCFFPPHFSQTPAHLFHFSTAPSIHSEFLLTNCPIL